MSDSTTTIIEPKKSVGRPRVTLTWPDGKFTVEQLEATTGLSKVTLYIKVKEAVKAGLIIESGSQRVSQGRPRTLFQKKSEIQSAVQSLA